MKKIIPFKKDIIFKTNVSEVTSISLEHTLHIEAEHSVMGEFIVSGDYKITDTSVHVEPFSYSLPFEINLDEKYVLDHASIDINDFYYEIMNENVLSVNIEVVMDKLEERLIPVEPVIEESIPVVEEEIREAVVEKVEEEIREAIAEKVEEEAEEEIHLEKEEIQIEPAIPIMQEVNDPFRCIEPEEMQSNTYEVVEESVKNRSEGKIESLFDHMDDSIETYQSYKVYIVREGDTLDGILEKYTITREEVEAYNDVREIKLGDKIIIPCVN